jgi:hypothetical protein
MFSTKDVKLIWFLGTCDEPPRFVSSFVFVNADEGT